MGVKYYIGITNGGHGVRFCVNDMPTEPGMGHPEHYESFFSFLFEKVYRNCSRFLQQYNPLYGDQEMIESLGVTFSIDLEYSEWLEFYETYVKENVDEF